VLLAALLHLLTCAHGPASVPGSDALPTGPVAVTAAAATATVTAATTNADSEHDPQEHCCHGDEPTIQAPRDTDRALPSAHVAASGDGGTDRSVLAPACGPSPAPPVRGRSAGRSLALLGVSRT
jgi:hypothetical protein